MRSRAAASSRAGSSRRSRRGAARARAARGPRSRVGRQRLLHFVHARAEQRCPPRLARAPRKMRARASAAARLSQRVRWPWPGRGRGRQRAPGTASFSEGGAVRALEVERPGFGGSEAVGARAVASASACRVRRPARGAGRVAEAGLQRCVSRARSARVASCAPCRSRARLGGGEAVGSACGGSASAVEFVDLRAEQGALAEAGLSAALSGLVGRGWRRARPEIAPCGLRRERGCRQRARKPRPGRGAGRQCAPGLRSFSEGGVVRALQVERPGSRRRGCRSACGSLGQGVVQVVDARLELGPLRRGWRRARPVDRAPGLRGGEAVGSARGGLCQGVVSCPRAPAVAPVGEGGVARALRLAARARGGEAVGARAVASARAWCRLSTRACNCARSARVASRRLVFVRRASAAARLSERVRWPRPAPVGVRRTACGQACSPRPVSSAALSRARSARVASRAPGDCARGLGGSEAVGSACNWLGEGVADVVDVRRYGRARRARNAPRAP